MTTLDDVLAFARNRYNINDPVATAIVNALAAHFNDTDPTGAALISCAITLENNAEAESAAHQLTIDDLADWRNASIARAAERGEFDNQVPNFLRVAV